jgi:hypothetical protein
MLAFALLGDCGLRWPRSGSDRFKDWLWRGMVDCSASGLPSVGMRAGLDHRLALDLMFIPRTVIDNEE